MSALTKELIREIQTEPELIQREVLALLALLKSRLDSQPRESEDLLPLAQTAWGPDWSRPQEGEAWHAL